VVWYNIGMKEIESACDCCLDTLPTSRLEWIPESDSIVCRACYQMFYESGFQELDEIEEEFLDVQAQAKDRF